MVYCVSTVESPVLNESLGLNDSWGINDSLGLNELQVPMVNHERVHFTRIATLKRFSANCPTSGKVFC